MKAVLIPLADNFEEIEAVATVDILRRAGLEVYTAGLAAKRVTGKHGVTVEADILLSEASPDYYDAIAIPGGPAAKTLREDETVLSLVRAFHQAGKLTAAICAAPTVLAAAGILRGVKAACFPTAEDFLKDAEIVREEVVEDGQIITSRGAGTAIPFALAIVARLAGEEIAREVAEKIIFRAS